MKVIYILDSFPKISETFVLNEILEMQKKGIRIQVFAFSKPQESCSHPRVKEVKVNYFPKRRIYTIAYGHIWWFLNHPLRYLKTLFLALNPTYGITKRFLLNLYPGILILKEKPNHIHAHFGLQTADMAMLINLLTALPYTFTTHRYDIFTHPPNNYRVKSKLAQKHITISEYNKRFLIKNFAVPEKQIAVVHCGIDFKRNFPYRIIARQNRIISIARLEKNKALENLIKACGQLKKRDINFECLIVGEGDERKTLETLIIDLGLQNEVKLLGAKIQDEVFELLAASTVKVLPSRSEGIAVVLMEAMAMKVPAIGPQIHGVPELINDGVNGYLIIPDDIEMLVDRIERLLRDKTLREKFAENAYLKVKRDFNLEIETDKLLAIWKSKKI